MLNDLERAQRLQKQYDGILKSRTVDGVNYLPVITNDSIDILFEGTSDLEDAKRDLDAIMTDSPFGRVHKGAWDGLLSVYAAERIFLPKDSLIRLDGHSLGAMRAGMFACFLFNNGYRNLDVLTFESPLWGDAKAVGYFNQVKNKTYRNYKDLFVHDIFTTIPVHLPDEPYVPPPNRIQFWSAPTPANEWKYAPENIQAHSLQDCVIPYLEKICGAQ